MESDSKRTAAAEAAQFGPDTIETVMRLRIRDTIERLVDEELATALGATKFARVGEQRQGYRHGTRPRTLPTSLGPARFAVPRARVHAADGTLREGHRAGSCRATSAARRGSRRRWSGACRATARPGGPGT